jgi:hypothetical protein
MKNLFDATVVNQVKTRLGDLELQSERPAWSPGS